MRNGVHRESVPAELNPGGLWIRLCTDSGELLAEHPLATDSPPERLALRDADKALDRVGRGEVVRNFIYDGDSGQCVGTFVLTP